MHLSTGSGRRQVCGVFMVSLVKPRLISFLCLLSLCSSGTLRLSGWCHRNIPKIPMAAIHARVRTCRPAQINAGMRTCLVSLNDPALMGVSGLTGGGQRHLFLLTGRRCFLLTRRQCFLLRLQIRGGGRTPFPSAATREGATPSPRALHQFRDLGGGVLGLCQRHYNVHQVS